VLARASILGLDVPGPHGGPRAAYFEDAMPLRPCDLLGQHARRLLIHRAYHLLSRLRPLRLCETLGTLKGKACAKHTTPAIAYIQIIVYMQWLCC